MVSAVVGHFVAAEALRYTVRDAARNRQNEYFAQGWLGHDDIGKRAATLTQRERPRVLDLHSATQSDELYVQSNIFGFVIR